ncbi:zinc finger domain-containing protein [Herbidospora sp. RD11066]
MLRRFAETVHSATPAEVERQPCPRCDVQPGSPCRSRSGAVAGTYHTRLRAPPTWRSGPVFAAHPQDQFGAPLRLARGLPPLGGDLRRDRPDRRPPLRPGACAATASPARRPTPTNPGPATR